MKSTLNREDAKDVLLALHQEYFAQIRHYDTQRSTVSNLLVIVAAAILAFVTFDKALTPSDLPLTFLLFIIGLFGAAFCIKYYERAALNSERFHGYQRKLDEVLFNSQLIHPIREETDKKHAEEFPRLYGKGNLSWVKVNRLWVIFHLLVSLLGLILTILAALGTRLPPTS